MTKYERWAGNGLGVNIQVSYEETGLTPVLIRKERKLEERFSVTLDDAIKLHKVLGILLKKDAIR